MNDWSLAEVVRRASELYTSRFPARSEETSEWSFPVVDMGGDFLTDPATTHPESDAVAVRAK